MTLTVALFVGLSTAFHRPEGYRNENYQRKPWFASVPLSRCTATDHALRRFSQVGIVTTCITLTGGSGALLGSEEVLNCTADAKNMSDVNIAMWCASFPPF